MSISNDLRQAVLQAAIQGKLTKQLPEDGNAKDLLEQFKSEKAKLVKEGKLKKEKPLPEITEDEKPFDIPENWEWVRIPNVTLFQEGPGILAKDFRTNGVPLIRIAGMQGSTVSLQGCNFLDEKMVDEKWNHFRLDVGDIVISTSASMDKIAEVTEEAANSIIYTGLIRFKVLRGLLRKYFKNFIKTPLYTRQVEEQKSGGTIKHYGPTHLKKMIIPLPPISEQKRIVAKVEELMAKIDELDKTEKELEALKKAFPADMKASLLQAAMQGKLTEQLAEDGNAKDLLEQIKAEKAKLIKDGKLKKEKPLPEITEDEIPFDIPEKWEWVRLGEVAKWGAGATPSKSNPDYYGGNIPWLLTGDLNNGYINSVEGRITELALKETSVKLNPVGSVLIAMYGATIGKLGILDIEATTNQACCAGIPYNGLYNKFLFYFLMAYKAEFIKRGEGGAQPNISREKIVVTLMPLPSLAEQKRIVEKLERLLPLCDGLK